MSCAICGSEKTDRYRGQWWDPDDGWRWGRLCDHCAADYGPGKVKPQPDDYAYDQRGEYDVDTFIGDTE